MRIVAYQTSMREDKVLLEESGGDARLSNSVDDLFAFLLEPYEDTIRVSWDLDSTISIILRLLGEEKCRRLRKEKRLYIPPFHIFYIPDKVFSVKHIPSHRQMSLYGLKQYFPDLDVNNVEEIQMLGKKLLDELKKMGMAPTKFTSPVAIYDECVLSKLDLPGVKDIPIKAMEYAYRASGRLWIEAHRLGFVEAVKDYDLSSAFPNVAKELVDTRDCQWIESSEYQEKAIYGFVHCKVTIYDWVMVSPILQETEAGLISPTGTWEEYLTKGELDFITRHQIGEYVIIDGWWALTGRKALRKPFKVILEKLLTYKQGSELQKLLAKRCSTGLYGKMGEEWTDEFGDYFNPVYFSEISTQTRIQVGEFLYAHGVGPGDNEGYRSLLAIGVDGVMLDKPLEVTEPNWRLAYEGAALILSSGLVYTATTKPKGLHLADVLKMIKAHPRLSYYETKVKRRLTLGDALAQNRMEDLGKEMDFSVSINLIDVQHDRDFPKTPKTGGQLLSKHYQSKPRRV